MTFQTGKLTALKNTLREIRENSVFRKTTTRVVSNTVVTSGTGDSEAVSDNNMEIIHFVRAHLDYNGCDTGQNCTFDIEIDKETSEKTLRVHLSGFDTKLMSVFNVTGLDFVSVEMDDPYVTSSDNETYTVVAYFNGFFVNINTYPNTFISKHVRMRGENDVNNALRTAMMDGTEVDILDFAD